MKIISLLGAHPCFLNTIPLPSQLQENIYNSPATPNIAGLPWINSLGNHDVLGELAVSVSLKPHIKISSSHV